MNNFTLAKQQGVLLYNVPWCQLSSHCNVEGIAKSVFKEKRIANCVRYYGKLDGPSILYIDLSESSEWEL